MRLRESARVLLLDVHDRLLLFKVCDPSVFDPAAPRTVDEYWVTVGGGLEPGESYETAARREVFEETGIDSFDMGPWVWERDREMSWQGEIIRTYERYFVGRTKAVAVSL